ncbi:unnamed protein product [Amoebophrya sp. A120]|nr:unnamed protein product [Amoebophrya sp. A120]|eukprot:GSA120T00016980001.1
MADIVEAAEREEVTLKLQMVVRLKRARAEMKKRKEQREAATKLQSMQRGKQARAEVNKLKDDKKLHEDMTQAAIKIQSHRRAQLARRKSGDYRTDAKIDAVLFALNPLNLFAKKKELALAYYGKTKQDQENAALKIQSIQRGKQARAEVDALREAKEQDAAASKIQAGYRQKQAREQVDAMRAEKEEQEGAATLIQSNWRGRQDRESQRIAAEQDAAATSIQAAYRGKQARKNRGVAEGGLVEDEDLTLASGMSGASTEYWLEMTDDGGSQIYRPRGEGEADERNESMFEAIVARASEYAVFAQSLFPDEHELGVHILIEEKMKDANPLLIKPTEEPEVPDEERVAIENLRRNKKTQRRASTVTFEQDVKKPLRRSVTFAEDTEWGLELAKKKEPEPQPVGGFTMYTMFFILRLQYRFRQRQKRRTEAILKLQRNFRKLLETRNARRKCGGCCWRKTDKGVFKCCCGRYYCGSCQTCCPHCCKGEAIPPPPPKRRRGVFCCLLQCAFCPCTTAASCFKWYCCCCCGTTCFKKKRNLAYEDKQDGEKFLNVALSASRQKEDPEGGSTLISRSFIPMQQSSLGRAILENRKKQKSPLLIDQIYHQPARGLEPEKPLKRNY